MKPNLLPSQIWVLVCDGAKALMLHNEGDALQPRLVTVAVFDEPQPPSRDLGTDRPGRTHSSNGLPRSATEETDLHEQAEADFLTRIAGALDQVVREHEVKNLLLVAPPKALGLLRARLSLAVKGVVSGEVGKDLTGLPVDQIGKRLMAA
jgi:protein required for attachment to host cells